VRRDHGITFLVVEHDLDFVMQAARSRHRHERGPRSHDRNACGGAGERAVIDAYLGTAR
jgi:ABC-type branched-subunit amino acid transport system ATPase component